MSVDLQVVGLVRFSALSPTFYRKRFNSVEEIAAHLYAPERMALRFALFEKLCLRSMIQQSDTDFQLVILTSLMMPQEYLKLLEALVAPHANIHCRAYWPHNHFRLTQRGYNSVPPGEATHRAFFRLDDDDGLDRNFIARTKRLAQGLIPLQSTDDPVLICHNRGFYARRADTGVEIFDACEHAPLSAGATLVGPAGASLNPYRHNHRRYAQHYSTFSDISVPAFLRTIHGDNKSSTAQMGLTHAWSFDQITDGLRQQFDMTRDQMDEVFI